MRLMEVPVWETLGTEVFLGKKKIKKNNQLPRAVAWKVLHRMLWKVSFKSCLEFQSGLGSPLPVPVPGAGTSLRR